MSVEEHTTDRAASVPSFLSLLAVHERLDGLFRAPQEALLVRDLERARELLAAFERDLVDHMRFEEERLFPVYERAGRIEGGGVALYRNEHAKLLRYVARFAEAFDTLKPDELGRIIGILDEEARFKNLMTHHDMRERNILYPTLDRVATAREARELL